MATDSRARQPSSGQLAGRLERFRSNRASGSDYYSKASRGLGVSNERTESLQEGLSSTEKSFANIDPSVTGRTIGSLVSEGQRRSMVETERAPVAEAYRNISGALSDEMSTQESLQSEANQRAGQLYARDEGIQSSLQKQYKKKLQSEKLGSERVAKEKELNRLLDQSRQLMDQQRRLAELKRASGERMARLDRLAKYGYAG